MKKNVFMGANILRYNHTPLKAPIIIHKETPVMVVIPIVRHCEGKSVAVLVVILMCDGFDQKSETLTLLIAILIYLLTKIVWSLWPMCDRLAILTKRAVTILVMDVSVPTGFVAILGVAVLEWNHFD